MPPRKARQLLGDGFVIGGTANTFEDILRLNNESVDYIGLGPFRFTTTKKNLSPVIGLSGYEKIMSHCRKQNIHLPVLAIGGITQGDISDIMSVGISGIAMSSAILLSNNPVEETKKIIAILNRKS
jgi:thiamine-phosphate pyrophosphorylase